MGEKPFRNVKKKKKRLTIELAMFYGMCLMGKITSDQQANYSKVLNDWNIVDIYSL